MKIYIYALRDDTGIRYVGQGANPKKRLRDHLRSKATNKKTNWIKKLLKEGKSPELHILEESDEQNFEQCERDWIAFGIANGWKLTNSTDGGIGTRGLKHNAETRKKMGDAKIGNTWNKGRVGNYSTPESRLKTSMTLTGRTLSAEHREKIRKAGMGRVQSPETRKKLSELHQGKVMSAESRRKMSEAKKGRDPWNKEFRGISWLQKREQLVET